MINLIETVASQYGNSPIILQLISNMNDYIDPSVDLDNFFNSIWNIHTATGHGLDVWGRIVGVNRTLKISEDILYLGFAEADDIPISDPQPFNQAPMFSGFATGDNYSLTDDAFRKLILVKALSNITDCSVPSINQILRNLFGETGTAYCTDDGDMTMTYTFGFTISPVDYAIITQSGAMPKPVGVYATVVEL